MKLFVLCALFLSGTARAQYRPMDAAVAEGVRSVLSSPAAKPFLSENPGLSIILDDAALGKFAPELLTALGPLSDAIPLETRDDLARRKPDAVTDPVVLVQIIENSLATARPTADAELQERLKEAVKSASRRPADAGRLQESYRNLSPYILYGDSTAARLEQFLNFCARVSAVGDRARGARLEKIFETMGHVFLESRPQDFDGAAPNAAAKTAEFIRGANTSVLATNPRGVPVYHALMQAAESGIPVTIRRAPEITPFVVIDNHVSVEFEENSSIMGVAERGWLTLADGETVRLNYSFVRNYLSSALRSISRLPPARQTAALSSRLRAIAAIMVSSIMPQPIFVALAFYFSPLLIFPVVLAFYGGLFYLGWVFIKKNAVRAAARNGWYPDQDEEFSRQFVASARSSAARTAAPRSTLKWENILQDTSWSKSRPYHKRLDEAFESVRVHYPEPEQAERFISAVGSPAWRPYLRETHLDVLWNFLRSETPATAAAAAKLLASLNPYFVAVSIEKDWSPWNLDRLSRLLPGDAGVERLKSELGRISAERPRAH